jgi:hypothetical protein
VEGARNHDVPAVLEQDFRDQGRVYEDVHSTALQGRADCIRSWIPSMSDFLTNESSSLFDFDLRRKDRPGAVGI